MSPNQIHLASRILAGALFLLLGVADAALAQRGRGAGAKPGSQEWLAQFDEDGQQLYERMLIENFERDAPAVGEPMPDVVVYDRDGSPLRLPELLNEHYTVLIQGCLT